MKWLENVKYCFCMLVDLQNDALTNFITDRRLGISLLNQDVIENLYLIMLSGVVLR